MQYIRKITIALENAITKEGHPEQDRRVGDHANAPEGKAYLLTLNQRPLMLITLGELNLGSKITGMFFFMSQIVHMYQSLLVGYTSTDL